MGESDFQLRAFRQMVKSDLQGGLLCVNGAYYDCTVGSFIRRDILVAAGVSPMTLGDAQVALVDLPDGFCFNLGQPVTVTPNSGKVRDCRVFSSDSAGALISLTLRDKNEGV